MHKSLASLLLALAPLVSFDAQSATNICELQTNLGTIIVELDPVKAPITSANFLSYVQDKFYNGTLIHRVPKNFVIQGGGYDLKAKLKKTKPPIKNEANNGLRNVRGTIAMARTDNPNSATSQFFINVKDNTFLDYTTGNPGYAVFGKVVKGLALVDKIKNLPTFQDFPITTTNSTLFIEAAYASESLTKNKVRIIFSGDGKGSVKLTPSGKVCVKACSKSFTDGQTVTLDANPSAGSVFSGWRGDCQDVADKINVKLTNNFNCTAVFSRKKS